MPKVNPVKVHILCAKIRSCKLIFLNLQKLEANLHILMILLSFFTYKQ